MKLFTHILLALLLGICLFKENVLFFAFLMMASIIPDIDIHIPFVAHRGIFHSVTAGFLSSLIFIPFSLSLSLAFLLGYCFHLLADSLTKHGIRPFWPHPYKTNFGFITTGGVSEQVFAYLIFALLVVKVLSIVIA